MSEPALLPLPLLWSGVGALRRDPRATETEPRKRGGETRDPEGERERVGTPSGREDGGRTKRTRVERTGENWTKGRGRKGKETGGSGEEAEEKRNRTGNGENQNRGRGTIPRRYAWKGEENEPGSGVRNEVERPTGTGRKEGEGTGRKRRETRVDKGGEIRGGSCIGTWREPDARKGKEAENAKGGETPLEKEDERSGENRTQGRGGKRSATKGH